MRETSSDMEEMSKWHPEEQGKGRMTEDKAHDEANAMRGELGVTRDNSTGYQLKMRDQETDKTRFPTSEDYDSALKVLDEAENATDIPTQQKILSKLKYGSLAVVGQALSTMLQFGQEGAFKQIMSHETLNKAQARLKELKDNGEWFATREVKK
jgi:hypothetical protein